MSGAQHRGDTADPGDAAQNDRRDHAGREQTGRDVRGPEGGLHRVGQRVGLDGVSGNERGEPKRHGEEGRHPLPLAAEAALDVVHRAACHGARMLMGLGADLAVLLGQRHLGELRRHAQQRRHPHPEQGSRAAVVDGQGRPGDVADAHRGGEGGGEGLEVGDVARLVGVVVSTARHGESVAHTPNLHEAEPEGEEEAGAQEGNHLQRNDLVAYGDAEVVDVVLDRLDELLDSVHGRVWRGLLRVVRCPWGV